MHLDEERLQRLLDGELSGPEVEAVREHAASCDECRLRLAAAERDHAQETALIRELEAPEPPIDFIAILDQVRSRGRMERRARRPLRWAASLILAAGVAGAAYAIPGSPVRGWIGRVAAWIGGQRSQPGAAPAAGRLEPGGAGISVVPGDRLLIQFESLQTEGVARVSWTGGTEVVVRASTQAPRFTSDTERLVIANHGSTADFGIEIPRAAQRVEVRVGPARVFLVEGGRVVAGGGPDSGSVHVIPLNAPPR